MKRMFFKRLWLVAFVLVFSISAFAEDDNEKTNEGNSTESSSVSDDISFTGAGEYNGHAVVDLGLSVKWATMNIGASTPYDAGDHYAWGEVYTKKKYAERTSVTIKVDMPNIAGNKNYDAAAATWGGSWRMPTRTEMLELVNRCEWTWTTQNEVKGYLVTGPNGNSIFLPESGYSDRNYTHATGNTSYYWTSTPGAGYSKEAFILIFYKNYFGCEGSPRSNGYSIRPVSK